MSGKGLGVKSLGSFATPARSSGFVILSGVCAAKDLVRRATAAPGPVSELLHSIRVLRLRDGITKERCAISETGTGFAYAKLSGGPPVRVAPFISTTNDGRGTGHPAV